MRVGQARRRDANEREIVCALAKIGVESWKVNEPGFPDLLVWRTGWKAKLIPIEIKSQTGRLTPAQRKYRGPRVMVRNVQEALAVFGVSI